MASAAALSGHLELAPGFDWIGTTPALVGFAVAAALELAAYLVPLLDNMLDALAAPAAVVAGTILTASSVVDVSPWLRWTLAIVAGGGIAGTVHLFTGATRLTSTATFRPAAYLMKSFSRLKYASFHRFRSNRFPPFA